MRSSYPQMQTWIGLSEGGYVNHPDDPGGATDRGITQATYDAWLRMNGMGPKPVRGISKEEAERIIEFQYFDKVAADHLPKGLDYAVADYAVNSGPSRAAKDLQRTLGFKGRDVDGLIGAKTLAAVKAAKNVPELIVMLCARRMTFLRGLRHWKTFGDGWTRRVMGRVPGVQSSDIGVADRAVRMSREVITIPAPTRPSPGRSPEPAPTLWSVFKAFFAALFGGKPPQV